MLYDSVASTLPTKQIKFNILLINLISKTAEPAEYYWTELESTIFSSNK